MRKSWHGTANIGLPRQTYLVVLVTAKNLGTDTEPATFTLSEFAVAVPKKSGTRAKILVPVTLYTITIQKNNRSPIKFMFAVHTGTIS